MFEAFAPLMGLAVIYLIIAVVGKAAKKSAAARKTAPGAPAASATVPESPAPQPAAAPQVRELQPTVRVHEHDDSVYQGSLNAVTGEGYDPCHEEQMSSLTRAETIEPVPAAVPGLQLHWTGDEIVRGLVISEILKRKNASTA